MYTECNACEGEGEIHSTSCRYNDSFDYDECDCQPMKCANCRGKGTIQEKRKNDSKFIEKRSS